MKNLLLLLSFSLLYSCVMDCKNGGCRIKNYTSDTLFMVLSLEDSLTDEFYWMRNPYDTLPYPICSINPMHNDTIITYINKRNVRFSTYYYVLPNCKSNLSYQIDDRCYLYVIKWNVAKEYSFREIYTKKMYDKRILTKKDFIEGEYEYRQICNQHK